MDTAWAVLSAGRKIKDFPDGEGLKEMFIWQGLPPSVQYGHSEPMKASEPPPFIFLPFLNAA